MNKVRKAHMTRLVAGINSINRYEDDCGVIAVAALGGISYSEAAQILIARDIFQPVGDDTGCRTMELLRFVRDFYGCRTRIRHYYGSKTVTEFLNAHDDWTGMLVAWDKEGLHAMPVVAGFLSNDVGMENAHLMHTIRTSPIYPKVVK